MKNFENSFRISLNINEYTKKKLMKSQLIVFLFFSYSILFIFVFVSLKKVFHLNFFFYFFISPFRRWWWRLQRWRCSFHSFPYVPNRGKRVCVLESWNKFLLMINLLSFKNKSENQQTSMTSRFVGFCFLFYFDFVLTFCAKNNLIVEFNIKNKTIKAQE